jgi:hypothetical protein
VLPTPVTRKTNTTMCLLRYKKHKKTPGGKPCRRFTIDLQE